MKSKFCLLFLTVFTIFVFPVKALGNGAFIEVTKACGALTPDNFKTLQNHGIDGIVIQLARGKRAVDAGVRTSGLKLAVSFLSAAASSEEAISEASDFINQIRSLGLPSDTPVVNELNDPALTVNRIDHTPNAATFRKQLIAHGCTNIFQRCQVSG
jgi:hypothetical protein